MTTANAAMLKKLNNMSPDEIKQLIRVFESHIQPDMGDEEDVVGNMRQIIAMTKLYMLYDALAKALRKMSYHFIFRKLGVRYRQCVMLRNIVPSKSHKYLARKLYRRSIRRRVAQEKTPSQEESVVHST